MLTIFFSALVFGFVFCLSPGAVLAETLRRGLLHGFTPALLVQIGSLVGDATWAVIGLTGMALLIQHEAVRVPLTAVCALYLAWLGLRSLLDAWRLPQPDSAPASSGRNALMVGAAISLANPKNIVYWGALGSALSGIVGATPSHGQTLMFFRFYAGLDPVVLFDRRVGECLAKERLANLATNQSWRLWVGIDLSGVIGRLQPLNLYIE